MSCSALFRYGSLKTAHKKRLLVTLAVVIAIAVALRIALPHLLKDYVNEQLAEMGPYSGHVQDVDVAVIRGAYTLHELTLGTATKPVPKNPDVTLSSRPACPAPSSQT